MKDRLQEPVVVEVAKRLCFGDPVEADKWWPALPFTQQTKFLERAVEVVEIVERHKKKPRLTWRNS